MIYRPPQPNPFVRVPQKGDPLTTLRADVGAECVEITINNGSGIRHILLDFSVWRHFVADVETLFVQGDPNTKEHNRG